MRKTNFFLAFIFLFFTSFSACGQYSDTLFQLEGGYRQAFFSQAVNQINYNSQKTEKIKQLINEKGTAADKLLLDYYKMVSGIYDRQVPYEQTLKAEAKYLEGAKELNAHYLASRIYLSRAYEYNFQKKYDKAFENFLNCYNELAKDSRGEFYQQGLSLHHIALDYYRYRDYDKTIAISKIIQQLSYTYEINPHWLAKNNYDLIGMCYLKTNQFDSARVWLKKAYEESFKAEPGSGKDDTTWMGIAWGNIGTTYYLQNDFVTAEKHFVEALRFCRMVDDYNNIPVFCSYLADINSRKGNNVVAKELLKEASNAIALHPNPQNKLDYFSISANCYSRAGDLLRALEYKDSAAITKQEIEEDWNVNKKIRAEGRLAYQKQELENEITRQKLKTNKWIQYGLLCVLLLLAVVVILFFKRQKLKHKLKQDRLEFEKIKAEEELHLAIVEIRDFTRNIKEKNELIETFASEIDLLKKRNVSIGEDQLENIEKLKMSAILTEEDWIFFKNLFNKVHPGYLDRLREKYHDLTPAEIRFFVFTRLEIGGKEMAAMLGVSAEAIRNIRFRVRKKINIAEQDNFEELAKGI